MAGTDSANLDGADDQIGSWSGTVPAAVAGDGGTELFSFQDVGGDQFLLADRPADVASFDAVFTNPVTLDSGRVSFDLGVRRTDGGQNKDLEIIGLDSLGRESFHLVISARSNGVTQGRVGIRSVDSAGTAVYDLPTVIGEDSANDLPFFSGTQVDGFGNVAIVLAEDGYTLSFSNEGLVYLTDKLAFNGSAVDLSRVRFTVPGSPNNGNLRGGLWLNDIEARGEITTPAIPGTIEIISCNFDEAQRNMTILFESTPAATYTVEFSTNLTDWFVLTTNLASQGTETEFVELGLPDSEVKSFYQITENP